MSPSLAWLETSCLNPYQNLAAEEELTLHVGENQCILFLWQNQKTVVIGRNQNAWKECRVSLLEEEEGFLARRLSGGGAVFHDLGNLNFSFIARQEHYQVSRQLQVILQALKRLGIQACRTGRNDLTADGRKFSGNAFYQSGVFCCHHGTLLVNGDQEQMSRYLTVSRKKLSSKGVASVSARTLNLSQLRPGLSIEELKEALAAAFSQVYGLPVRKDSLENWNQTRMQDYARHFASPQWKYGRRISFDYELGQRFGWGEIQLQLHVKQGVIEDLAVYSDALDSGLIRQIEPALQGQPCQPEILCRALRTLEPSLKDSDSSRKDQILSDLQSLIQNSF